MRFIPLIAAITLVASASHASEIGAHFSGQKPEEVISKIAEACMAGGLGMQQTALNDVTCNMSGQDWAKTGFRGNGTNKNADDWMGNSGGGIFFRFIADPAADGATVREHSVLLFVFRGRRNEHGLAGAAAYKASNRLRELFASLGGDEAK